MTAQEKIKEAHFFLRKLRENSDKIPDAYYYYSAFLSATLSILDHLMHDYAQKFNFTIPDDIRNLRKEFEKEAKNTNNHDALKFHEWWKSKKEYLTEKNEYGKIFSKKRHYNIHRDTFKPNQSMDLRQTAVKDEGIISFIPARGKRLDDPELKKYIESEASKKLERVNEKLKERGEPPIKNIEKIVIMYDEGFGTFELCSAGVMYLLKIETILTEAQKIFDTQK